MCLFQVHASQTENFLVGKSLLDSHVVQGALDKLASEVDPDVVLTDASPAYRKGLAQSLFYKVLFPFNLQLFSNLHPTF